MKKQNINYETLIRVTNDISLSRNPDHIVALAVERVKEALDNKGCALFLLNQKTKELEVSASTGLSSEYLNKGPVSAFRSITQSLKEGPVAIFDAADDPRIQYPKAAKLEGIASILSVPILVRGQAIGAMRVYTSEHWDFTPEDIDFVRALAQIVGLHIDICRLYQGQKEYIHVLTTMDSARAM
jgi:signal transduction protein with GAF and PtsI domain